MKILTEKEIHAVSGATHQAMYNIRNKNYLVDISGIPFTCVGQQISMLNDSDHLVETNRWEAATVAPIINAYLTIALQTRCDIYFDIIQERLNQKMKLL